MAWDKLGNPANPKGCGKCCGADTGYLDSSPCSPSPTGIYPNAGRKMYLQVDWEDFTPSRAGYFDRAKILQEVSDYNQVDASFEFDSVSCGVSYNFGLPVDATVTERTVNLSPFTLELEQVNSGVVGPTYPNGLNECLYGTPNAMAHFPLNFGGGDPGTPVASTIADAESQIESEGYLRVQGAAFDAISMAGQHLASDIVPPETSPRSFGGLIPTTAYTYYDYTDELTFGGVYASAQLDLSSDLPKFAIKLYQVRRRATTVSERDATGVLTGNTETSTEADYFILWELDSSSRDAVRKVFNCSDFPVFFDSENGFSMQEVTGREGTSGIGDAYDEVNDIYTMVGLPLVQVPLSGGNSFEAFNEPFERLPSNGYPEFYSEQSPLRYSPWPHGWVRPHPDWDPGNGSVVSAITTGPVGGGSVYPTETFDCFGLYDVDGGIVNTRGNPTFFVYVNGYRNLNVAVLPESDFVACNT